VSTLRFSTKGTIAEVKILSGNPAGCQKQEMPRDRMMLSAAASRGRSRNLSWGGVKNKKAAIR